jgi:streptogramin lyase
MLQEGKLLIALLAGTPLVLCGGAWAATVTGDVSSDGKPLRGAMVTLFSEDGQTSETVFSNSAGQYRLQTRLSGHLSLRARAPLAADVSTRLDVPSSDAALHQSIALKRLSTPQEISDSLPASAHAARVKFPTLLQREQFQLDCSGCHVIGTPATRQPRPLDAWTAVMKTMVPLADYTTDFHVRDYAEAMSRAFDGTPTPDRETHTVDEAALSAKITEWKLPTAKFPHDSAVYPPNGMLYTVDQFADQIYITDPKTNKTQTVPIPAAGIPIGGSFAGESGVPDWIPKGVRHSFHSLALSPFDGQFYMTGSVGGVVGVFDPVTHAFRVIKIPGASRWAHTIRFDAKGFIWINTYLTDQIIRLDPKTGESTIIALPTDAARRDDPKDERIPAPYGLDINPVDGSVWYTKRWANKIGRVDPVTFRVTEWVPPIIGPHRARFDSTGGFWIAGLGDGTITRLDTSTMNYETYKIPTLGDDELEAPYALIVDPKTQNIWVTANASDRMFRFAPQTKTWTAFPLPTRGLYFREIAMTPDGSACSPSSPIPPDIGAEGNTLSITCVQPDGDRPNPNKLH